MECVECERDEWLVVFECGEEFVGEVGSGGIGGCRNLYLGCEVVYYFEIGVEVLVCIDWNLGCFGDYDFFCFEC